MCHSCKCVELCEMDADFFSAKCIIFSLQIHPLCDVQIQFFLMLYRHIDKRVQLSPVNRFEKLEMGCVRNVILQMC